MKPKRVLQICGHDKKPCPEDGLSKCSGCPRSKKPELEIVHHKPRKLPDTKQVKLFGGEFDG